MKLGVLRKQPREELTISVHYEDALDTADAVDSVLECFVTPPGTLVAYALVDYLQHSVRVFISDGEDRQRYKVTVLVRTVQGEVLEDEVLVQVREL